MKIYRLTNKVTHLRCIVVAPSSDAACKIHPTNDLASWRGDGWYVFRSGGASGGFHGFRRTDAPKGWPVDLSLIHVDELGSAHDNAPSCGVEAYQASEDLRQLGEGPDDSWGGRSLRELGGSYADFVDEDTGPLFGG